MKNFILGILTVLVIEFGFVVWNCCAVKTETTFIYNPDKIVSMFGEAKVTVK